MHPRPCTTRNKSRHPGVEGTQHALYSYWGHRVAVRVKSATQSNAQRGGAMSVSLIKGTAIPRQHVLRTSGVAARVGIVGTFWAAITVGFSTPVLSLAADATHV